MQVLAFCSQKGGVGKTTLAGHIAVQIELAGAGPAALIDCDPQGSLSEWWNARESATPAFVATSLARLPEDLERLRADGCRYVVIDTPPAISMAIQRVINLADLVVIPTRPSPHDLRAVGATADMAERAQKRQVFVISDATLRARITSDAAVALSQHGTVAPVYIHHRTIFASAMIDGRTVMEVEPGERPAKEIALLWEYLALQLDKEQRRRQFHQPAGNGFGRRAVS